MSEEAINEASARLLTPEAADRAASINLAQPYNTLASIASAPRAPTTKNKPTAFAPAAAGAAPEDASQRQALQARAFESLELMMKLAPSGRRTARAALGGAILPVVGGDAYTPVALIDATKAALHTRCNGMRIVEGSLGVDQAEVDASLATIDAHADALKMEELDKGRDTAAALSVPGIRMHPWKHAEYRIDTACVGLRYACGEGGDLAAACTLLDHVHAVLQAMVQAETGLCAAAGRMYAAVRPLLQLQWALQEADKLVPHLSHLLSTDAAAVYDTLKGEGVQEELAKITELDPAMYEQYARCRDMMGQWMRIMDPVLWGKDRARSNDREAISKDPGLCMSVLVVGLLHTKATAAPASGPDAAAASRALSALELRVSPSLPASKGWEEGQDEEDEDEDEDEDEGRDEVRDGPAPLNPAWCARAVVAADALSGNAEAHAEAAKALPSLRKAMQATIAHHEQRQTVVQLEEELNDMRKLVRQLEDKARKAGDATGDVNMCTRLLKAQANEQALTVQLASVHAELGKAKVSLQDVKGVQFPRVCAQVQRLKVEKNYAVKDLEAARKALEKAAATAAQKRDDLQAQLDAAQSALTNMNAQLERAERGRADATAKARAAEEEAATARAKAAAAAAQGERDWRTATAAVGGAAAATAVVKQVKVTTARALTAAAAQVAAAVATKKGTAKRIAHLSNAMGVTNGVLHRYGAAAITILNANGALPRRASLLYDNLQIRLGSVTGSLHQALAVVGGREGLVEEAALAGLSAQWEAVQSDFGQLGIMVGNAMHRLQIQQKQLADADEKATANKTALTDLQAEVQAGCLTALEFTTAVLDLVAQLLSMPGGTWSSRLLTDMHAVLSDHHIFLVPAAGARHGHAGPMVLVASMKATLLSTARITVAHISATLNVQAVVMAAYGTDKAALTVPVPAVMLEAGKKTLDAAQLAALATAQDAQVNILQQRVAEAGWLDGMAAKRVEEEAQAAAAAAGQPLPLATRQFVSAMRRRAEGMRSDLLLLQEPLDKCARVQAVAGITKEADEQLQDAYTSPEARMLAQLLGVAAVPAFLGSSQDVPLGNHIKAAFDRTVTDLRGLQAKGADLSRVTDGEFIGLVAARLASDPTVSASIRPLLAAMVRALTVEQAGAPGTPDLPLGRSLDLNLKSARRMYAELQGKGSDLGADLPDWLNKLLYKHACIALVAINMQPLVAATVEAGPAPASLGMCDPGTAVMLAAGSFFTWLDGHNTASVAKNKISDGSVRATLPPSLMAVPRCLMDATCPLWVNDEWHTASAARLATIPFTATGAVDSASLRMGPAYKMPLAAVLPAPMCAALLAAPPSGAAPAEIVSSACATLALDGLVYLLNRPKAADVVGTLQTDLYERNANYLCALVDGVNTPANERKAWAARAATTNVKALPSPLNAVPDTNASKKRDRLHTALFGMDYKQEASLLKDSTHGSMLHMVRPRPPLGPACDSPEDKVATIIASRLLVQACACDPVLGGLGQELLGLKPCPALQAAVATGVLPSFTA